MPEPLRESNAWRRLEWHHADVRHLHLREAFDSDPTRGERMAAEAAGLYLDYSKHLVTDETLGLLRRLAAERDLGERVRALDGGELASLRVVQRARRSRSLVVGGTDVVREAYEAIDAVLGFAERVRSGTHVGATGRPLRSVVALGTGELHIGPALAYEALRAHAALALEARFVAGVDPSALAHAMRGLDPEETLVVLSGANLAETGESARAACAWLTSALGEDVSGHLAAVSPHPAPATTLGVSADWVFRPAGWSGAPALAVALGPDVVHELRAGLRAMDEHFLRTRSGGNLPVVAGLLDVWYRGFFGAQTTAVLPSSHELGLLPAYVRQVDEGSLVTCVWGGDASTEQEAGLRFLHRGAAVAPADLIGFARSAEVNGEPRDDLAASLLAVAQSLAFGSVGDDDEDAEAQDEGSGNHPTSVLLAGRLTPATLGALVAFYEHRAFTSATVWHGDTGRPGAALPIDLSATIRAELAPGWKRELMHDSSTNALIRRYRALRDGR